MQNLMEALSAAVAAVTVATRTKEDAEAKLQVARAAYEEALEIAKRAHDEFTAAAVQAIPGLRTNSGRTL